MQKHSSNAIIEGGTIGSSSPPDGFCYDIYCNDVIIDNKNSKVTAWNM